MRAFWVVVSVVFSLLSTLFAGATVYSLFAGDDDLPGNAILLTGSLPFAALGWYALRLLNRSAPAAAVDLGRWLPAADPADGDHPELNARLRRASHRATGFAVGWAVVFAAGFTGVALAGAAADDLLATGFHEPGVVVGVFHNRKGTSHIRVRHGDRTDDLVWESNRAYQVGEQVIVIYDPADPARVRTADEQNENQVLLGSGVVPMLAALFGLPFSIGLAAGWRRRIRAVERTGWRRAGVTDDQLGGSQGRYLDAEFRDGTAVALRRSWALLRLSPSAGWKNKQAWVGGWGKAMVVGTVDGPYVLAVHAIRERVSRSPR
ncbi:hypothetical protein Amsp01_086030 [Amycolatopsis sp. NBRC 101858]|uniref:DUF3592 domain-containing protein n=1 Tax=Amycolatopsis sp. NBRC 101858 TaxID=3032200 RepID=UPI0024A13E4A|nr:DUF3592 domain-containing protein [Amycolatopsis sp. NBRC 101858]GLY42580.1 hypothetical protein Amsp01_086030 [Amycolatopsis sp. NBRC 101858]